MPECMVCLVINSVLLLAVAAAFSASASSVDNNDAFFRATQAARISMVQLVNEIRCCNSVQVGTNTVTITRPTQTLTPNEASRTFTFDSANKRLTLQITYSDGSTSTLYTLASNVTAASLGPADTGTDSNNATVVVRVPISLTVTVGQNAITLNGAATPRRALRYS